jgi:GTP diphosphokinase / guanosine-3',5'-bis(diphosphate) 3'-diphosphatase
VNTTKLLLHAALFAADRHRDQRRKGSDARPYINHPLEVANLLSDIGGIEDPEVLAAAILHDTVEDTETSEAELKKLFGKRIASIVMEVTDDKSLEKAERKRLQIEHAPHLTPDAKAVKLADKISNITEVIGDPPKDWSNERRREYIDWAIKVVDGLRGVNPKLEERFDATASRGRQAFGGSNGSPTAQASPSA